MVFCAVAGAGIGAFGAWAYSSSLFRPLAHTLGMWVLLAALVSARQPLRHAVVFASSALLAAVPAFYAGRAVIYDWRYPGGSSAIDGDTVVLWLVLALVAGPLLGLVAHRIGTPGRLGAVAVGTTAGLLVADAARRGLRYSSQLAVLLVFLVVALVALWLRARPLNRDQWLLVLCTLPPAALFGYLLVSAPDLLEDLLT